MPFAALAEAHYAPSQLSIALYRAGDALKSAFASDLHSLIKIGGNRFRNSFISFRVAETRDIQLAAMESGNSPGIIRREYLELAPAEDATKWFAISSSVCKVAELEQDAKELLEAQNIRERAA